MRESLRWATPWTYADCPYVYVFTDGEVEEGCVDESEMTRAEALGAVIARLNMIRDLAPGSRGAYQKFVEAQTHAREALNRLREAGVETEI